MPPKLGGVDGPAVPSLLAAIDNTFLDGSGVHRRIGFNGYAECHTFQSVKATLNMRKCLLLLATESTAS